MTSVVFTLVCCAAFGAVFAAKGEFVIKKNCKDVDQNQCTVHNVAVYPCERGPAFCSMKKDKKYGMSLNLTPKFSANRLKLSINGDVKNDESFSTEILPAKDGCDFMTCPLAAEERRLFDVDLTLDKKASGKFPVKVMLWNEEDETQACCFTFTVKVK